MGTMKHDQALAALRRTVRDFDRRHTFKTGYRASSTSLARFVARLGAILDDVDTVSDVSPLLPVEQDPAAVARARAEVIKARSRLASELAKRPNRG